MDDRDVLLALAGRKGDVRYYRSALERYRRAESLLAARGDERRRATDRAPQRCVARASREERRALGCAGTLWWPMVVPLVGPGPMARGPPLQQWPLSRATRNPTEPTATAPLALADARFTRV